MTPLSTNQSKLTIVVKSGLRSGQCFVVPIGESLSFGRTNAADVAIDDDHFMSGKHFEIINCGEYAELRDFKSTNKTWVNNIAITTAKLQSGDTFRAGKTVFSLEWEKQDSRPDPEPASVPVLAEDSDLSMSSGFRSPISSSFGFPIPHTKPIPDEPRPNADYVELQHNNSPIESLDETYEEPETPDKSASSLPIHSHMNFESFGSPLIDDSDVSRKFVPQMAQIVRLESRSTASFWSLVSKLTEQHSTQVVAHFQKIGMLVPNSLRVEPVFKEMSESMSHMPVIVDGKEWLRREMSSLTERLAKADGIMMMVSLDPSIRLDQLQVLSRRGVPGFSEEGGFLGWCWPSQWHTIGQRLNDPELRALMGNSIHGVIYPWCGTNWAHVVSELSQEMRDLGFE